MPTRISAPDSRFGAEGSRTVPRVSLLDFDVPPVGLQAMPSPGRDIGAIGAIPDSRHGAPSDALLSTLSPIGALPQLALASFGSPHLAVSPASLRCGLRARDGHARAGATRRFMKHHVVNHGDYSSTLIIENKRQSVRGVLRALHNRSARRRQPGWRAGDDAHGATDQYEDVATLHRNSICRPGRSRTNPMPSLARTTPVPGRRRTPSGAIDDRNCRSWQDLPCGLP